MIALIIGLFIGFIMCIPLGPINILVINTNLKQNGLKALAIAAGGSLMDFVYFFTILSGLTFIHFNERISFLLKNLGVILIFILGVKELTFTQKSTITTDKKPGIDQKDILGGFILGVLIYTSNPTLILTMSGLGAFVKSLNAFPFNQSNIILISLGLSFGSFLWFVFLIRIVNKYQEKIRHHYFQYFNKISGILLISIGTIMIYKLYF